MIECYEYYQVVGSMICGILLGVMLMIILDERRKKRRKKEEDKMFPIETKGDEK